MFRRIAILMAFLLCVAVAELSVLAQEAEPENSRAIVARANPVYPELARRLNLQGTVKLQVTVAADGAVKSIQVIGGNPVLVAAAQAAVSKYRWAPAKQESRELVEMNFRPR